eukprot:4648900-Prymnesium_polylepis.1
MPQQRSSRAASPARLHRKMTLLYTMCTNYSRNEPGILRWSRGSSSPRTAAREQVPGRRLERAEQRRHPGVAGQELHHRGLATA